MRRIGPVHACDKLLLTFVEAAHLQKLAQETCAWRTMHGYFGTARFAPSRKRDRFSVRPLMDGACRSG